MLESPPRQKILIFLALLYTLFHLAFSVFSYNPLTNPSVSGDLLRALEETKQINQSWETFKNGLVYGDMVFHPLLYYAFLSPFRLMDSKAASLFFYGIQFLIFPAAIYLLTIAIGEIKGARTPFFLNKILLSSILALNFQPFLETLAQHKIEGIEFFLICCAIWFLRKDRPFWAGALICLATNLKYYPGILIGYFLLKRQRKVLWGVFITQWILVAGLACFYSRDILYFLGIRHPMDLLISSRLQSNQPQANLEWQTLSGTIIRYFTVPLRGQTFAELIRIGFGGFLQNPALVKLLSLSLKGILIVAYVLFIRNKKKPMKTPLEWPIRLLEISLTLGMIFFVVQALRVNYAILVLPAFLIVGHFLWFEGHRFHGPEKVLFLISYFLAGMVIPGGVLNRLPPHPLWGSAHYFAYLWFSLPFFGYAVLMICILLCHRRLTVYS